MMVAAWILGVGALSLVPILVLLLGPDAAKDWIAAYFAGAAGGLMLELIGGGWGLELPSTGRRRPTDTRFAPFGPWIDLGFLGRMTTGAVAGPVFLILIRVLLDGLDQDQLSATAQDADTLAWAVLIGAASPAAWKAGENLVSARLGGVANALAATQTEKLKQRLEAMKEQVTTESVAPKEVAAEVGRAIGAADAVKAILTRDRDLEERH